MRGKKEEREKEKNRKEKEKRKKENEREKREKRIEFSRQGLMPRVETLAVSVSNPIKPIGNN